MSQIQSEDITITLKLSIRKDALDHFNGLGLSDKARYLALSCALENIMENMGDNKEELAWYVEHAATLPDAPKTVILPVALPAEVAAKYRVRCSDVGQDDLSAQASKDLTDLANSW